MSGQATSEEPIAEMQKKQTEAIRVRRTEPNGIDLLEVRVWTGSRIPGSESKPTEKGLAFRLETWA